MRACSCSPPSRSPGPAGRRCKEKRVLLNFARPTMPIRSPLPAAIAALLCISLPAGGQDHAPDRARKTGTVAPTSVGVSFKEWTVPTPRSFPHDPLAAADGAIWWRVLWGGWIRRRVLSKNFGRRRPTRVLMDWLPIRMETSGSRRASKGISASSIRSRGRSSNITCRILRPATRIRLFLTGRGPLVHRARSEHGRKTGAANG
jgi:hypothetical protein